MSPYRFDHLSLPSLTSRKEAMKLMSFSSQFIQELHKCVGKRMPQPVSAFPLYPLPSTPHHPSPRRHSSLAQDYILHIIRSYVVVHLRNAAQGEWLSWGIWGSQVPVIRLGSSPRHHLGAAATPVPHNKERLLEVWKTNCTQQTKVRWVWKRGWPFQKHSLLGIKHTSIWLDRKQKNTITTWQRTSSLFCTN